MTPLRRGTARRAGGSTLRLSPCAASGATKASAAPPRRNDEAREQWGPVIRRGHPDPAYAGIAAPVTAGLCGTAGSARACSTSYAAHAGLSQSAPGGLIRFPKVVRIDGRNDHGLWSGIQPREQPSGLFVATYAPAEVGEMVELVFSMPGMEEPCVSYGTVEWVRPHTEATGDARPGMGVRLHRWCEQARQAARELMAGLELILYEK
jgi:Tfp pilus assembly protein PilZ